jgi:uncharacterized protein (DUF2384 family)
MSNLAEHQNRPASPSDFSAIDSASALKGFFGIMDLWGISNEHARIIIGSPSSSTFFVWKRGDSARLSSDTLRRIGYVAGIYKALQIIYSDPGLADSWVNRPNRHFNNQTPLQRMVAGDVTDLAAVMSYLDAARAPWS